MSWSRLFQGFEPQTLRNLEEEFRAHLSLLCLQVFSLVHAQVTFFHQGSDLLRDLEPTMKTMAAQVLSADLVPAELLDGT